MQAINKYRKGVYGPNIRISKQAFISQREECGGIGKGRTGILVEGSRHSDKKCVAGMISARNLKIDSTVNIGAYIYFCHSKMPLGLI